MKTYKLCLIGFGNVARHLVGILASRRHFLKEKHGVAFEIAEICEIGGAFQAPPGFAVQSWQDIIQNHKNIDSLPGYRPGLSAEDVIASSAADILIELTPTKVEDGQPALQHMLSAFQNGMHVVTANKGPLVVAYRQLIEAAEQAGRMLKFGCATAAALPTTNIGYYDLAGCEILAVEGILNGTSNYILSRMHQDELSYEAVLREAQEMGIAERDPRLDVSGFDTAVKCIILANALFDARIGLSDAAIEGIETITPQMIAEAKQSGEAYKLIGRVERCDGEARVRVCVTPQRIAAEHPLYTVNGTAKAVAFTTDLIGTLLVSGGNSSPTGAAAAILRDLINLAREEVRQ